MSEHGSFEYFDLNLEAIIRQFIDEHLKHKDWEIIAVDRTKNIVILKRWIEAKKMEPSK